MERSEQGATPHAFAYGEGSVKVPQDQGATSTGWRARSRFAGGASAGAAMRRPQFEDDDAEVLVQPRLLVWVAMAVLLIQLGFDRRLDA